MSKAVEVKMLLIWEAVRDGLYCFSNAAMAAAWGAVIELLSVEKAGEAALAACIVAPTLDKEKRLVNRRKLPSCNNDSFSSEELFL